MEQDYYGKTCNYMVITFSSHNSVVVHLTTWIGNNTPKKKQAKKNKHGGSKRKKNILTKVIANKCCHNPRFQTSIY